MMTLILDWGGEHEMDDDNYSMYDSLKKIYRLKIYTDLWTNQWHKISCEG